jgi:uncharacterized membrane protein
MPRFCSSCGSQIPDAATVCPSCNKAVAVGGGAAAAPAQAPAASSGLSESAASGLAYITIIPAIIFLVMAPYNQNPRIKFHCFQCLGLALTMFCCGIIMIIPILGWIIGILGYLTTFVFWVICIIKAFSGGRFKLPVIGNFAEKQAGLAQ